MTSKFNRHSPTIEFLVVLFLAVRKPAPSRKMRGWLKMPTFKGAGTSSGMVNSALTQPWCLGCSVRWTGWVFRFRKEKTLRES